MVGIVGAHPAHGMSWVTILASLLKLAYIVAGMVERNKLLDAGEAIAIRKALEDTNARVEKAHAARRAAAASGMRDDDPYLRD
jgi:hypothetical protein